MRKPQIVLVPGNASRVISYEEMLEAMDAATADDESRMLVVRCVKTGKEVKSARRAEENAREEKSAPREDAPRIRTASRKAVRPSNSGGNSNGNGGAPRRMVSLGGGDFAEQLARLNGGSHPAPVEIAVSTPAGNGVSHLTEDAAPSTQDEVTPATEELASPVSVTAAPAA